MPPSATDRLAEPLEARDQVRTIARATFDGFLQSDLMPQGMQAPAIIWAAAFLVAPALFLPAQFMVKYPLMRRFHPDMVEMALWDDRMLFMLMSAGAMGLVSVVLWDTLFPARRDAFVLTPLPVALPVQMLGRLAGLITLCLVFVVTLNGVPAFTFPVVASASFAVMPRTMIGHLTAAALADVFVFFSVTALQGIVILGFGRRSAARLAAVAQTAAVLCLVLTLLFIGGIREVTRDAILRGDMADPILRFAPIAWFLGLYELIAGTPRAIMTPLAVRALIAALAPLVVTVAIYFFGYQRLLARAVETPPRSRRSLLVVAASRVIRLVFVRRPEEQAICAFVLRAIARSGRHSMLMSMYLGGGLALMITAVLPDVIRFGSSALGEPRVPTLALPLILSAALAVGVRIIFTIPAEMNARWLFQTTGISPRRADAGAHKAMLLIVVPPVILTAAVSAAVLWDRRLALPHAAYCGALSLVLCEVLLARYRGIPLTRPYVPGGSRIHMLWAFYLSAFLTYTFTATQFERTLLHSGGTLAVLKAAAVFGAIAFVIWLRRKSKVRTWDDVLYDAEIPEDVMFQGFNLTEVYAAQAVAHAPSIYSGPPPRNRPQKAPREMHEAANDSTDRSV